MTALILGGCAGLGVLSYLVLEWTAARQGPIEFFEPESIPDRPQGWKYPQHVPVGLQELTEVLAVKPPKGGGAAVQYYRGFRLADVAVAVIDFGPLDTTGLPPLDDDGEDRHYVGAEIAARSSSSRPIPIDALSVEVVEPSSVDNVYPSEYVEMEEGHNSVPNDGSTVTFRAVFVLPRGKADYGVRIGVWGESGAFERAVLPSTPHRATGPDSQPAPPAEEEQVDDHESDK